MNSFQKFAMDQLPSIQREENYLFSRHTTMGIGGRAAVAVIPKDLEQLTFVLRSLYRYKIPYIVIGRGSNVLASDRGFEGVVIDVKRVNICRIDDNACIEAQCGAKTDTLIRIATAAGLGGLSFLCGIPATVGGTVFMNAGVRNTHMSDVVTEVSVFQNGKVYVLSREDCSFEYKHTKFMDDSSVVLSARLQLIAEPAEKIKEDNERARLARKHLPKGKSMGCVFKNPSPTCSAGALIESCGLKGLFRGDLILSPDHCNFIINTGRASAREVCELIAFIKQSVYEKTGILLSEEIRYIGEF